MSFFGHNFFLKCYDYFSFLNTWDAIFAGTPLTRVFGNNLSDEFVVYAIFTWLSAILVNISVVLTTLICKKFTNNNTWVFIYIGTAFFVGLMPWILVPYTDTFAMFVAVLALYSYVCIKNKAAKASLLILTCIIGFNIKPSVVFFTFALLFVEICRLVATHKKGRNRLVEFFKDIKKYVPTIVCSVLSIAIGFAVIFSVKDVPNFHLDKNKEYSATHYLMLGCNPHLQGLYSASDVEFSNSCTNKDEREEKNLEVCAQRFQDLGPLGTLELYMKKAMFNYCDGTFMWGVDGGPDFARYEIGKSEVVATYVDNFCWPAQVIWFFILLGCIMCLFTKNKNKYINVISATLLMLSLFLMVFEAGSRYLILYIPYYIVMATYGWGRGRVLLSFWHKGDRLKSLH